MQQLNKVNIWLARKKNIVSLYPEPLLPCCFPQLQILSAARVCQWNFWLSHRKEKLPLTQGLNYCSVCDNELCVTFMLWNVVYSTTFI